MSAKKAIKLANYLKCDLEDAQRMIEDVDYLVLNDEDAHQKAKEYILDTVWAFNPSFLSAHLKDGVNQEVVELIQGNGKCEDNNKAILSLIDDVEHFVEDAIACDGRGHFLASYDNCEICLGNNLYAYRVN